MTYSEFVSEVVRYVHHSEVNGVLSFAHRLTIYQSIHRWRRLRSIRRRNMTRLVTLSPLDYYIFFRVLLSKDARLASLISSLHTGYSLFYNRTFDIIE